MNESKLKILKEAFVLFLRKNFKEVTMQELVERTGLSKGAFYHYFKSKEQLFEEAIDIFLVKIPASIPISLDESSLYNYYHDYLGNASRTYAVIGQSMKDAQVDIYSFLSLNIGAMKRLSGFREQSKKKDAAALKKWAGVIRSAREKGEISTTMTDEQIACFFKFTMEGMGLKSMVEEISSTESDKELLSMWDNFYEQIKV